MTIERTLRFFFSFGPWHKAEYLQENVLTKKHFRLDRLLFTGILLSTWKHQHFYSVCARFTTQIFDDAYKSQLSCVVVDDIERLLGESHTHSVCLCCGFQYLFLSLLIFCTMIHRLRSDWPQILEPGPASTAGFAEESTTSCVYHTAL